MRVDLFDYELPEDRIAAHPARPRDSARLLDLSGEALTDRSIRDLPDLLGPNDLLISNDTKVIPARLVGRRDAIRIEVTLHKLDRGEADRTDWAAFCRPAKRLKPGDMVVFSETLSARVEDKRPAGDVILSFPLSPTDLLAELQAHGEMPLPPYIKRPEGEEASDPADYQTVFAKREGAVAAPTAGLHFTPELLARIDAAGIRRATVTLHVGAGTFLPVKADDTDDHRMHSEWGEIGQDVADAVAETRARGGRVISIGTTSLRILEAAGRDDGTVPAFSGDTDLFIVPGYRFKVVDMLLTNFHLPRSTLLMLVSAFSGRERILAAYEHAVRSGYRFFSYGDATLLRRAP